MQCHLAVEHHNCSNRSPRRLSWNNTDTQWLILCLLIPSKEIVHPKIKTAFFPQKLIYYTFAGLPMCPELTRDHIPKARDVGHFLSVTGTVIRTSVTKVLEFERDYMCNKCRHVFSVQASFEQFYTFTPPTSCPNEDGCNSFKFTCLSGSDAPPAACKDYQEIKIQEQVRHQGCCLFRNGHPGATWC